LRIESELHTDDTDETDIRGFVYLNRTLKKGKKGMMGIEKDGRERGTGNGFD